MSRVTPSAVRLACSRCAPVAARVAPRPPIDPWVLRLLDMPCVGAAVARGIRECA